MRAVPETHLLLQIRRPVDWAAVEAGLARYYDRWAGRPSYPPAVLRRMLVLEQFADLSDREVHEQVGYNLLYRAFVGLGVEEPVPDDTTLVRFRDRVGEEGIRQGFATLNQQWAAAGLIGSDRRVLDGVHLWAKVARRSFVALLRQGRAVVVEAVAEGDPARAATLRAAFVPPAGEPEPRGEEAVRAEGERTAQLLAALADCTAPPVQARVAQVRTLLTGEADRVVSFDDPDARWGYKAADKPFCGYKAHEALDPDSRLITAVDVVPGNAHEGVRTDTLLARTPRPPPRGPWSSAMPNTKTPPRSPRWKRRGRSPASAGGPPCGSATPSPITAPPTSWSARRPSGRSARCGWTRATSTTSPCAIARGARAKPTA